MEGDTVELNDEFDGLAVDIGQGPSPGPVLERRAIVVVGSHRSGTSAVARVLGLVGCDLPKHVMPPLAATTSSASGNRKRWSSAHEAFLTKHRFVVGRRGSAPGRNIRVGRSAGVASAVVTPAS